MVKCTRDISCLFLSVLQTFYQNITVIKINVQNVAFSSDTYVRTLIKTEKRVTEKNPIN